MNEVIHIHEDDFQKDVLQSPVPVLVDFSSVLCGPCNRLLPVLNELASDLGDRAKVVAVEVTTNERLAEQYGIASIPTLIVFQNGHEGHRMIGLKSKAYLRDAGGMNPKVQPTALAKLVGREADEPVTLKLRTTMPLTSEQIAVLTAWGGQLLFDSEIMAVVSVPSGRFEEIVGWDVVLEVV